MCSKRKQRLLFSVVFTIQWLDFTTSRAPSIQGAAANQQPLLIVYKQSTVRAAAFKIPLKLPEDQSTHNRERATTASPLSYTKTFPTKNSTKTIFKMNPIRRRESVCRNLFGAVDHEQLRRDLKQRLREITEQDSRRWNFNFQTDTPMCGRFQWEEIPSDCAASIYQESAQLKEKAACSLNTEDDDRLSACEESAKTDQENCSSISNMRKCPAEVTPIRRKRTHAKSSPKPRNNTKITGK